MIYLYSLTKICCSCVYIKEPKMQFFFYICIKFIWHGYFDPQALQNIPRSCYYVATKVGRYLPEYDKMFDFTAERTLRSIDESLARLGIQYIDIIQVCSLSVCVCL